MKIIVTIEIKPGNQKKHRQQFPPAIKTVGEKLKYQTPNLISKNMKTRYLADSRQKFLIKKITFYNLNKTFEC